MNLEMLLNGYLNDPRCFKIVDRVTASQPQQIQLTNLHGSAAPFIISAVFNHASASQLNHLIILRDAEEAAYFHNTLENITSALNLFYFPSSFKNKKNYRLLNASHVMLRTECLTRFSNPMGQNRVGAIVTYPEALFEKVVLPKTLSANIISIKQGDTIDTNAIYEKFVGYGFTRTDFVYEPGQFAVRGGILDIYSFGNEKPYRIELFGNEVDSIRIFDPETQLSERKLLQVSIIPNVETQFDSGEKVSIMEFLPENTVVWSEDWNFIKEKIQQQEEDLQLYLALLKQNPISSPSQADDDESYLAKNDIDANDFVTAETLETAIKSSGILLSLVLRQVSLDNRQRTTDNGSNLLQKNNLLSTASLIC